MKSLILIGIDTTDVRRMMGKLDDKDQSMKKALKKAVNETAKQARKRLVDEAKKKYAVKKNRFNESIKIKNATTSKPVAYIISSGEVNELMDFKVSPARYATGEQRPDMLKGKVVKAKGMKRLQIGSLKAFITKFSNGHQSVVQRTGKGRKIKKLLSPSAPVMLGNRKRVYGIVEPYIGDDLRENLRKFVSRQLGG
ncbi:phage tail protein [Enterocloster clostridioformis]|uniref:phage tail protein n=1 Tax=Enterocloster clostridioformis TaxID=1531 RepID=UPI001F326504|nr:phage tail protein [Enterocloster clostridioformis]MCF2704201.1 phage tail protein [Enterocloster clostridioformis]